MHSLPKLHQLSFLLKLAVTCCVLVLAGGYAASLYHLREHVSRKDGDAELSRLDLVGTYHGVDRPAPMLRALDDEQHRAWLKDMKEADFALLRDWLSGDKDTISKGYDTLPLGAPEDTMLPSDVVMDHCIRCHAVGAEEGGGIGGELSLERWPGVEKTVYTKKLSPVSIDILATSTHTHALSMPVFLALGAAFLLLTAWPLWLRHGLVLLAFLGLLLDLSGMWLAREWEWCVNLIVAGGGLMGAAFGLTLLLSFVGLWLPRRD